MNRREFIRGLLSVAVVLATPIPALKRKITSIRSDFIVDYDSNIIYYVGGSHRYTTEELYRYLQEEWNG